MTVYPKIEMQKRHRRVNKSSIYPTELLCNTENTLAHIFVPSFPNEVRQFIKVVCCLFNVVCY